MILETRLIFENCRVEIFTEECGGLKPALYIMSKQLTITKRLSKNDIKRIAEALFPEQVVDRSNSEFLGLYL